MGLEFSFRETSKVKVKILDPKAKMPTYADDGASGFDLYAIEDVMILPQQCKIIRTGLAMEFHRDLEIQIRPRSGISSKTRLRIANSPGTIDQSYRGELCIIMENIDTIKPEHIKCGDRIAQAVLCPIITARFEVVEELGNSERGNKGFGSTGGFDYE